MLPIVMAILAVTSIYAGILMFHQDSTVGFAGIFLGIVLLINPLLTTIRRMGASPGRRTAAPKSGSPRKKSPRKTHLKLVKQQDEESPTIH